MAPWELACSGPNRRDLGPPIPQSLEGRLLVGPGFAHALFPTEGYKATQRAALPGHSRDIGGWPIHNILKSQRF